MEGLEWNSRAGCRKLMEDRSMDMVVGAVYWTRVSGSGDKWGLNLIVSTGVSN